MRWVSTSAPNIAQTSQPSAGRIGMDRELNSLALPSRCRAMNGTAMTATAPMMTVRNDGIRRRRRRAQIRREVIVDELCPAETSAGIGHPNGDGGWHHLDPKRPGGVARAAIELVRERLRR